MVRLTFKVPQKKIDNHHKQSNLKEYMSNFIANTVLVDDLF